MTQLAPSTRQTAYTIHLANQVGNILPSRLKVAFQHSSGENFQLADKITLKEMLSAVYAANVAYTPTGSGIVMKDAVQATERFLSLGLIPSSFA